MEEKRYYYKVSLSNTHRGRCIQELIDKGNRAVEAANELAASLGAESRTDRPGRLFPGVGIGSLKFHRVPNLLPTSLSVRENIYRICRMRKGRR